MHEIGVTRNLGASRLHDFLFGGLNNHIEHHLFPSMPTARLRGARRITREVFRRHGIAYSELPWLAAAPEGARPVHVMFAFAPCTSRSPRTASSFPRHRFSRS